MSTIVDVALRRAAREGAPLAHQSGRDVCVVFSVDVQPEQRRVGGMVQSYRCESSGIARATAARVLDDLRNYPWLADDILRVSALYAEAAWRKANRRMGRVVELRTT